MTIGETQKQTLRDPVLLQSGIPFLGMIPAFTTSTRSNGDYKRGLVEEPPFVNLLISSVGVPSILFSDELDETNETTIAETLQRSDDVRRIRTFS